MSQCLPSSPAPSALPAPKFLLRSLCLASVWLACLSPVAAMAQGVWRPLDAAAAPARSTQGREAVIRARKFRLYGLDAPALRQQLWAAPAENRREAAEPAIVSLPGPDGKFRRFSVEESPTMAPELQARFPQIRTFTARGLDDPAATARLDFTEHGFHAQVFDASGAWYIDPRYHLDQEAYMVYAKQDMQRKDRPWMCLLPEAYSNLYAELRTRPLPTPELTTGPNLRTFRLAVACTGEYGQFVGGTVNAAVSAIVTTVNRVNGIYEKELAIRFVLIGNNQSLVYLDGATDPYTNNDSNKLLTENQTNVDQIIGTANYDIGHVFNTKPGGLASLGVVCSSTQKAQGETGSPTPTGDAFDVDYVAHEIGHQFGANHTFNSVLSGCAGSREASTAYEPGSGSTIMGYTTLCGADDLQTNSDPFFHAKSFDEIETFVATISCQVTTSTGNRPPTVTAPPSRTIPNGTAFTLTANGTDPDGDAITYLWEQYNLGPAASLTAADNGSSPIFRSVAASTNPTRSFPRLSAVVSGTLPLGEKFPTFTGTATRTLNFRVSVRDNRPGGGGVNQAETSVVVATAAGPFEITSQNTAGVSLAAGGMFTVTWNVAGTDSAPINTSAVNLTLSTDGGVTFPVPLASGVPNNGSANVNVPSVMSTQCRVRIEAVDNIYYAVNRQNFTINTAGPTVTPVPPTPTPTPVVSVTPTPTPTPPPGPTPTPTVTPTPGSSLINVSTRLRVGTEGSVAIAGFVISGTGSKRVLIRSLGPTLTQFGVTGVLADPTLELLTGQTVLDSNDNWRSAQQAEIQASGFAPPNDLEPAIVRTLSAGAYTAILRGANATTGVGIVEVYDLDSGQPLPRVINLSTRGLVGTGDGVMIAGVVISGTAPKKVLIRALGPSLANFGVSGALSDPQVSIVNASQIPQGANDNWQATQAAEISAANLAPPNALDSAIILTLPPGSYTAIVSGVGGATGVALVEVYDLP